MKSEERMRKIQKRKEHLIKLQKLSSELVEHEYQMSLYKEVCELADKQLPLMAMTAGREFAELCSGSSNRVSLDRFGGDYKKIAMEMIKDLKPVIERKEAELQALRRTIPTMPPQPDHKQTIELVAKSLMELVDKIGSGELSDLDQIQREVALSAISLDESLRPGYAEKHLKEVSDKLDDNVEWLIDQVRDGIMFMYESEGNGDMEDSVLSCALDRLTKIKKIVESPIELRTVTHFRIVEGRWVPYVPETPPSLPQASEF